MTVLRERVTKKWKKACFPITPSASLVAEMCCEATVQIDKERESRKKFGFLLNLLEI